MYIAQDTTEKPHPRLKVPATATLAHIGQHTEREGPALRRAQRHAAQRLYDREDISNTVCHRVRLNIKIYKIRKFPVRKTSTI